MGGMRILSRACVALFLAYAANASAADVVAMASNGSTVILHDNGRWEYHRTTAKFAMCAQAQSQKMRSLT